MRCVVCFGEHQRHLFIGMNKGWRRLKKLWPTWRKLRLNNGQICYPSMYIKLKPCLKDEIKIETNLCIKIVTVATRIMA